MSTPNILNTCTFSVIVAIVVVFRLESYTRRDCLLKKLHCIEIYDILYCNLYRPRVSIELSWQHLGFIGWETIWSTLSQGFHEKILHMDLFSFVLFLTILYIVERSKICCLQFPFLFHCCIHCKMYFSCYNFGCCLIYVINDSNDFLQ